MSVRRSPKQRTVIVRAESYYAAVVARQLDIPKSLAIRVIRAFTHELGETLVRNESAYLQDLGILFPMIRQSPQSPALYRTPRFRFRSPLKKRVRAIPAPTSDEHKAQQAGYPRRTK